MFVYAYIAITFILLLVPFLLFAFSRRRFSFTWWLNFLLFISAFMFIWQSGAWPYIGFYWRYILLVLFAVILFRQFKKPSTKPKRKTAFVIVYTILVLPFLVAFNYGNREMIIANSVNGDETISLSFPLKNGNYVIQQGGNSELANISHRSRLPHSEAYDIIKLNKFMQRGGELTSQDVTEYAIFGDTVYSPCDCVVERVIDGIENNIPPVTDRVNRDGNSVTLKQGEISIRLCHLEKGELFVKKGQHVTTGTPIGLVGNSGFTIEPHLHIQAFKKNIRGNEQYVIVFDDKIHKLNDIIRAD